MRKTLLIAIVLLTAAVWLQAQDSMSKESAAPTSIQGCLSVSGNHYLLTDSSGMVYHLSTEANKLSKHVGHEIKVTGMAGVRTSDTTVQGDASSAKEQTVFKVKTVTHVADTCSK